MRRGEWEEGREKRRGERGMGGGKGRKVGGGEGEEGGKYVCVGRNGH